MTKLLVFRFSAMGDVALLCPALKGLLKHNPDVEVYLLTQAKFFTFFQDIDRLHLIEIHPETRHKGVPGLFRLFNELRKTIGPHYIIDVHKVIRTYILDILFWISGYKVIWFRKGKPEKKKIIKTKLLSQLPLTVERYAAAFERNGFRVVLPEPPVFSIRELPPKFEQVYTDTKSFLIGIAPFAKYPQKIWGMEKIEGLIL